MVSKIDSVSSFDQIISDSNLTVVHFSAEWVEQCKHVNDVLNELCKYPEVIKNKVKICECLAENLPEISLKNQIDAVPTVIFFKSGKTIDRIDGADAGKITEKVKKHSGAQAYDKLPPVADPEIPLETRLKNLIHRHDIMVFMKGDRQQPRCGFSKQLIQILQDIGTAYDTFDILQDEEVRQGLKTYSDWPTYPQVYVKGELIGGLDIIKELLSSGELMSTLKGGNN